MTRLENFNDGHRAECDIRCNARAELHGRLLVEYSRYRLVCVMVYGVFLPPQRPA